MMELPLHNCKRIWSIPYRKGFFNIKGCYLEELYCLMFFLNSIAVDSSLLYRLGSDVANFLSWLFSSYNINWWFLWGIWHMTVRIDFGHGTNISRNITLCNLCICFILSLLRTCWMWVWLYWRTLSMVTIYSQVESPSSFLVSSICTFSCDSGEVQPFHPPFLHLSSTLPHLYSIWCYLSLTHIVFLIKNFDYNSKF